MNDLRDKSWHEEMHFKATVELRRRIDRFRAGIIRYAAELVRLPSANVTDLGREVIDREQVVQIALTLKELVDEDGK